MNELEMKHRPAELEGQALGVPATPARPGRRRHRDMDRQQALSRLVPLRVAGSGSGAHTEFWKSLKAKDIRKRTRHYSAFWCNNHAQ
jgi:hypothetical protein